MPSSRIFVLTAVRHGDATTAALHEIGAKTNEIPQFARSWTPSTTRTCARP
ncbi:hypothetical protein ACFXGR_46955 [Streptomyces mirabilis]|uniref:hypothetical protein n=1 Tax=Streptomyces mirabilis TaxID=68239 RepID=UPI003697FA3B